MHVALFVRLMRIGEHFGLVRTKMEMQKIVVTYLSFVAKNTFLAFLNIRQLFSVKIENFIVTFFML